MLSIRIEMNYGQTFDQSKKDQLPESQLIQEQKDKWSQSKPLVYKRNVNLSQGMVKGARYRKRKE